MTCSFAVRGALKKFAEVQKAEVSLNRGIASMQMKPGNKIKVTELWEVVTRNGFTTKETKAVLRGEILEGARIRIPESGEIYSITGSSASLPSGQIATFDAVLKPGEIGVLAELTLRN